MLSATPTFFHTEQGSKSQTPIYHEFQTTTVSTSASSQYLRAFEILTVRYGADTACDLKPADIILVIQAGDAFLRPDSVTFISSFVESHHAGIWHCPALPRLNIEGSLAERLIGSFRCAELLDQRVAIDPIRLRMARVLLCLCYQELCGEVGKKSELSHRRSRGRDNASVATDLLLEQLYQLEQPPPGPETWKRRRNSLRRHIRAGNKWNLLTKYLGAGILLVCRPDTACKM
jgi:hypothetical protein